MKARMVLLEEFLKAHFTPTEFFRFAHHLWSSDADHEHQMLSALPDTSLPPQQYFFQTCLLMDRVGAIDDGFFIQLFAARPNAVTEISDIALTWGLGSLADAQRDGSGDLDQDGLRAALIRAHPGRAEEIRAVVSALRSAERAAAARGTLFDGFCMRCSVRVGTQLRSCSSIRGHQFARAPQHAYCRVCGCVPGDFPQSCVGGRESHAFASADVLPCCSFCGREAGKRTTCSGLRSTHEFMA